MKKIIIGLFILGFTSHAFAQKTEQLSEVFISATNYKYLSEVDSKETPVSIKLLQQKVATHNLKSTDFYEDEYNLYYVTFYIPQGKILAAYDSDGNILRTVEKFKGNKTNLPSSVYAAISDNFPGWAISKDVYLVNYHTKKGVTKKYKVRLKNNDKTMRIKFSENGKIL